MTKTVNDIAALIREVDGDNTMDPRTLGVKIAGSLAISRPGFFDKTFSVVAFVERTNPDKRVGAGALAELIVAEFNLDEER